MPDLTAEEYALLLLVVNIRKSMITDMSGVRRTLLLDSVESACRAMDIPWNEYVLSKIVDAVEVLTEYDSACVKDAASNV